MILDTVNHESLKVLKQTIVDECSALRSAFGAMDAISKWKFYDSLMSVGQKEIMISYALIL